MNTLTPFLDALGLTLVHSLWQGLLIGILCFFALRLVDRHAATLRYLIAWGGLVAILLLVITTFLNLLLLTNTNTASSVVFSAPSVPDLHVGELETNNPAIGSTTQAMAEPGASSQLWERLTRGGQRYAALIWMAGVLVMSIRLGGGWLWAYRLKYTCTVTPGPDILHTFERLAQRAGLRWPVNIRLSSRVEDATLVGWAKPVVLLPVSVATGLSIHHIEAIIAHELAHAKRYDYLLAGIQAVIEALLFYHPAAWWITRQIRIEREHCCDDLAVKLLGSKTVYARALYKLELKRSAASMMRAPMVLSVQGGHLLTRIRRLVGGNTSQSVSRGQYGMGVGVLLALVTVSVSITSCQDISVRPEEPMVALEDYKLPISLTEMIDANDSEGAIAYLHDMRESDTEGALSTVWGAYKRAADQSLRSNIVYVFAHFNTYEADKLLIQIAKSDPLEGVRFSAINSIASRTNGERSESSLIISILRKQMPEYADLFVYPNMTSAQLITLLPDLQSILQDERQPVSVRQATARMLQFAPEKYKLDSLLKDEVKALIEDWAFKNFLRVDPESVIEVRAVPDSTDMGAVNIGTLFRHPLASNRSPSANFGFQTHPNLELRQMHNGIDFTVEEGTPVYAVATGTVTVAEENSIFGKHIKIDHGDGYETVYAHLGRLDISAGEKIEHSTRIGLTGNSGLSSGPHLHFELRKDGSAVDPSPYLPTG